MKKKILLLIGFSVFAVWLCIAFFIYQDTKKELESVLDIQLKQAAKILLEEGAHEMREGAYTNERNTDFIENNIKADENNKTGDTETRNAETPETEMNEVDSDTEGQLSFQMRNHEGSLLLRSSQLMPTKPLTNIESGFDTQYINNEPWRIYALWTNTKDLQVQVAQKIAFRQGITTEFRHKLLLPIFVFLPALLLFVFFAIKSGLKPFTLLSNEIKNRGPKDLKQIEVTKYPIEIIPIVNELNQLLQRLLTAIDAEKRLTADASHELRTPLAALKVQAQVALEASDLQTKNNSLIKINDVIDGLSRRVSQLLMLAKLDSETFQLEKSNCDLHLILQNELALQAPKILEKDINIIFSDKICMLTAYPDLLAVLARNLIENAIRHTPKGGEIKVLLEELTANTSITDSPATAAQIILQVIDSGPGIHKTDFTQLFERFYQPKGSNKEGSGLGLSIVKKIAEIHQARLVLYNRANDSDTQMSEQVHEEYPLQQKNINETGLVVEVRFNGPAHLT